MAIASAAAAALTELEWLTSPALEGLFRKSISFLGSDYGKDLEDFEWLAQIQRTTQAPQYSPHKAQLARWFKRLKEACYDAEDIFHEIEYERLSRKVERKIRHKDRKLSVRVSSKLIIKPLAKFADPAVKRSSLLSPLKKKLLDRLKKLKEIEAEAKTFHDILRIQKSESNNAIITGNSSSVTSSFLIDKVFGRDGDRDEIINFLLDKQGGSSLQDSCPVVAVTGIGGVGKTTLVQYVYNDERVKNHFGVRMWLCVSQKFDITNLTKEMIECASEKECPNLSSLDLLQDELIETLPKSAKIMVVLDGVWYDNNDKEVGENKWNNLLKPLIEFASRGGTCKIVVTSRSASFPSALLPGKLIELSDLAPNDFISLLRYHAIDGLQINDPQLKNDLSDIVDQLRLSVPLAPLVAKVVGNQLHGRLDIEFWQAILRNVNWSTDDGIAGNSHSITSSLLSDKVFGHDGDRDEIINFLLDDKNRDGGRSSRNYSVIAITDIGGVGKTTLARYVYNDERVKNHFGVRMWLCVSQKFDITDLTKEMIECASEKKCPDLSSLDLLQDKLIETLRQSDKIMVVLDDVWYDNNDKKVGENKWNHLLKPLIKFASQGGTCKIVVTSRSASFPLALHPGKLIELSNLAPNEFISLLRYHAIDGFQINDPQLKNDLSDMLGELEYERPKCKVEQNIVGEDRKLSVRVSSKPIIKPLANFDDPVKRSSLLSPLKKKLLDRLKKLKEIAAEAKTFHDILGIQNTECNDAILTGNSSSVTSSFLIDKVFGRDGDRDEIINFLLDKQGGSSLQDSCPVVAVTGIGGVGKTTLVQYVYNDERVKNHFGVRMWLCVSQKFDITDLLKEMIECASEKECPNLSSLDLLQEKLIETLPKSDKIMVVLDDVWYDNNDKEVGENKWNHLLKPLIEFASQGGTCKIVVTSRSASFPSALPPGKLIELSDLAPNDFISLLRYHAIDGLQINDPQLKNDLNNILDQLSLSVPLAPLVAKVVGNWLRKWPDFEFWQATLRNVNWSTDDGIAGNSLSITSSLLSDKVFGRDGDRDKIINFLLDDVDRDGGSSSRNYSVAITDIGGVGKTTLAQYVYNDERFEFLCTVNGGLHDCSKEIITRTELVLENLKPNSSIKELNIVGYTGGVLPPWLGSTYYSHLQAIFLSDCTNCIRLPPLGNLPFLQDLHIKGMHSVKSIDCKFFCGNNPISFPSLKKLVFENMASVEKWTGHENCELSHLSELVLKDCGNLQRFAHNFPSLTELTIEKLPNFVGLRRYPSLKYLKVVSCSDWIWESWRCLSSLHYLTLSQLSLETLPDGLPKIFKSLQSLEISHCNNLTMLPDDWIPPSVNHLCIRQCPMLRELPKGFEILKELEDLEIQDCKNLEFLPELKNLKSLTTLEISGCHSFVFFPSEGLPDALHFLCISDCPLFSRQFENLQSPDRIKIKHVFSVLIDQNHFNSNRIPGESST